MKYSLALATALAVYTSFGYELTTSNYYEYPSCKPDCLQNRGGCPNNVPCHQKLDSVYLIEATGNCYLSLSTCWGCLKDEGVSGVDTNLLPVTCPIIPTAEPSATYYEYPSCKPDCLQNRGGCPNNEPCHQIADAVYHSEANDNCYLALTTCWGCLRDTSVVGVGTHLEHVMCPTPTAEPTPEPTQRPTSFECSAISSSDRCMVETDCLWLPFTNPPRCGSMEKCEDNCAACSGTDCVEIGAGGNAACAYNSRNGQCFGRFCDNNCRECRAVDCDASFAPPMGCFISEFSSFYEGCVNWEPTSEPTPSPIRQPTDYPTVDPTINTPTVEPTKQ